MNYATERADNMAVLPLPAGFLVTGLRSDLEKLDRSQLEELILKMQRDNINLRMHYHRELGLAYGVISPMEYLNGVD
jgi:hypothetical protein